MKEYFLILSQDKTKLIKSELNNEAKDEINKDYSWHNYLFYFNNKIISPREPIFLFFNTLGSDGNWDGV